MKGMSPDQVYNATKVCPCQMTLLSVPKSFSENKLVLQVSHREPSIYLLFWWLCAFEFDFLKWNPTNVRFLSRNGNVMWQVLNAGAGTSESAIALAILIVAPITLSLIVWFEFFKTENEPWGSRNALLNLLLHQWTSVSHLGVAWCPPLMKKINIAAIRAF